MKLTLNLASRSYVNERALRIGCLVISLLLLLLLGFQLRNGLQSREQNTGLRTEIAQLRQQLKGKIPRRFTKAQIALQQQEFGRAQALLSRDAFRWTALFDRMEALLPENVSIRSFNPNYKDKNLQIVGIARSLTDLQTLLDNLHGDNFKQVFLKNQNQIEVLDYVDKKRTALEFSIQLQGVF